MNKERLFIPVLILFLILVSTFAFIYFHENIKPYTAVLAKKDFVCQGMPLIEALQLAKGGECTQGGELSELQYTCNTKEERIEVVVDVTGEKEGSCVALCYIYTSTREVELDLMCRGELD